MIVPEIMEVVFAPTADDSDGWLASMRHIAIESGAFVVSVSQFIPASAFPDDFPVPLPPDKDSFGRGGAAVVEPTWGEVGPSTTRRGSSSPTATSVVVCTRSAGSTPSGTTAERTCSPRRWSIFAGSASELSVPRRRPEPPGPL